MTQPPDSVKEQMPVTAPSRSQLRQHLRQLRRDIPLTSKQEWDLQITDTLRQRIHQLAPRLIGVYWPIQQEPDLQHCFRQLHNEGYQLALPIVVSKSKALKFVAWAPDDAMDQDDYGIPIPQQREQTVVPDLLIIPCVGFNQQCYRLGYGGGFYDRTLAALNAVNSIGVAYQLALTEFAAEKFDLPLGEIVTELGIVAKTSPA
ncbi:5-formyltetrahydrofolate cyclo-ligase [Undibacterium seohonense]|uniref:5-formyltetrahydrofolate cyclo-ligase n=1 Tax=Undibacterium seohonense TaxID=1344950 RepID=A0ABR6X681_9BURK|nr:5-formyltetrahydrofolate cyclo-ligase [Undibacterium seohonense]MBC3808257.1 5-formyltetrahydrofolate cyclo-ligase [Undibacterium seohonense]